MLNADVLGYIAACLILAAFCMKSTVPLRTLAIMSNLAFVGYGYFKGLPPVLLLHSVLLPVNAYRLGQSIYRTHVARGVSGPGRRVD